MHYFPRIFFLIASMPTILAACGGGGGTPDTTAPTVSPGSPSSAEVNVSWESTVTAVFNEPMNSATINTSTFTLKASGTPMAGGVSYSGVTATFTPVARLAFNVTYTATITTGVQDISGNGIASDESWSFTTEPAINIQVSWNGNPETAVNRSGGGYKVYYNSNSGFNPGDVGVTEIDAPYISGVSAPTSVLIGVGSGTYYVRVAAYSSLNAPATSGGSISTATPQIILTAP
jgi:hypothetical protein